MIDAGADEHYIIFGVYNICGREHHHAEHAVVIYPGRAPPASGQEASTNPILTLNDRRRRRRILLYYRHLGDDQLRGVLLLLFTGLFTGYIPVIHPPNNFPRLTQAMAGDAPNFFDTPSLRTSVPHPETELW